MEDRQSFAQMTKIDLCSANVKKRCCRRSLLYGMLMYTRFSSSDSESETATDQLIDRLISEDDRKCDDKKLILDVDAEGSDSEGEIDRSIFECPECVRHFIRGAFISCGTITNPGRGYRAEMIIQNVKSADSLYELLSENSIEPKRTERAGAQVLYYKESEKVEDFLILIGAQKAMFEIMNTKIYRELRNNANRITNCDTANIDKSLSASLNQVNAINYLKDNNLLGSLPPELRETAELRLKYPDKTLNELAALHEKEISKSGVNHRLQKILNYVNSISGK